MKKILITTGGTGGHVIPARIIEEHLKNDFEIFYSTDLRGLKYLSSNINKTKIIDTPKLNLSFYLPFKLIKLLYLIFQSIIFLKKEKIEKVISIGGYMSIPIIIGAKILGLTIFLLEPNLLLGRSNKLFLNFSKKIFCYSDKLSNFPKKYLHKIQLIKPLVYKAFYQLEKKEDRDKKFCFLISGGSQGAKIFDELIMEVMIDISKNFSIKIIQQTSLENIEKLKNFYESRNIENKIFNFEEKFINLINMSDLCITRAGATSLAEISILNKPFIAIPLPTAKDNHQMKNAQFYEKMGCCWVLDQKTLNKEKLLNIISNILKKESDLIIKKLNLEKLNYKNSWNDVNQKLQKTINEN
ncbi:UDP-N-acetylglucosamine--N-acetylmuramyl-(pentapeptide) pyrophosphoryl-undecaprenol N-acetylglucosamine transferase [Candidatus Pelagibacter sp.]|nr:UDP-N-acetylglucosamine--N-acetylmuramyl-(pentapeptide) pyrophosphoryl-undecaprenol N-acetylglucosamine transferase [Candidatus Pelagibacter sp.]